MNRAMRALSIRQPYAELIPSTYSGQALRGIKTVEYRTRPKRIIGERFYIYASKAKAKPPVAIWSDEEFKRVRHVYALEGGPLPA